MQRFVSIDPLMVGVGSSFLLHVVFAICILFRFSSEIEFPKQEIYSVTVEGGKSLGAITQAPKEDKKTPVVPPKKVSEPEEVKKVPDAELSLNKNKPKPTPVPKPTPKVVPTPVAKKVQPKPVEPDPSKEYQKAMQRYLGESANAGGKGFGAARVGGTGMGGGVQRSAAYIAYSNLLVNHVKRGWRWFNPQEKLMAKVFFKLSPNGDISAIQIVESSGNQEFDNSIIRAVAKANPAPPPPTSEYDTNFKEVRIYFDPRDAM